MIYYIVCVLGILSGLYMLKQLANDPMQPMNFERRAIGLLLCVTFGFTALIWTLDKQDQKDYNRCIAEQTANARMLDDVTWSANGQRMESAEQFAEWACKNDFDIEILIAP